MPFQTSDIQDMIDAIPDTGGYLRVPPGEYVGGSIAIRLKSAGNSGARTIIDMEGVELTPEAAGHYILVDACKRLTLRGVRAQGHDLLIQGMWLSTIDDIEVSTHNYGGGSPGSGFRSSAWNSFRGGFAQRILFHENQTGYANALWYYGVTFRGGAGQGYTQSFTHSIEFRANCNVKGLRFYGGDISGASVGEWKIGTNNTAGQIDCIANGVYLDAGRPYQTINQASPRRVVEWKDCYNWAVDG